VRVRQSCLAQKQKYIAAVNSLNKTYQFLENSTPAENRSTINRTVKAGLRKQEEDLKTMRPTPFCNNIGPEIPPTPERPPSLRG
jgi:hypothetical protein